MVEILILSLIQGVTEFLPVSSSSHLIIVAEYIKFEDRSLSIDVSLHIGSFLAVIVFFYKDILKFFKNFNFFLKIFLSSIPVILVGFFLVKTNFIDELRKIEIIGWTTLIFGFLLFISDKFDLKNNIYDNFNIKSALIIGIFQIMSLIPGVSRSGITITAARILKFKRFDAGKISFLLSIPTLGAVSIYGVSEIITNQDLNFSILNLFAVFFSFLFSIITIKYFLKYIQKFSFNIFVFYRLILGVILLIIAYL